MVCRCADSGSTSLTQQDIAAATGIPANDLARTLQALACAKFKILLKEPRGREINDGDRFSFNHAFTSPLAKFKVQTILGRVETAAEVSETHKKIDEERRNLTEVRFTLCPAADGAGRDRPRDEELQGAVAQRPAERGHSLARRTLQAQAN